MFYRNIEDYAPDKLKRLTGGSKNSLAVMVDALVPRLCPYGRPSALRLVDRLLMVLMYWRKYSTFEHK